MCRSTVRRVTRSGSAPRGAGSIGWRSAGETIERLEAELTGCIGCGCLSMKACALLNPGDALAEDGAGPRRL